MENRSGNGSCEVVSDLVYVVLFSNCVGLVTWHTPIVSGINVHGVRVLQY